MLHFLRELWARVWAAQLASLGTTSLAVGATILIFLLHFYFQYRRGGWNTLKLCIRKEAWAGVKITIAVWLSLLLWNMLKIVYEDHQALSNTVNELARAEKLIEKKRHSLDPTDPAFNQMLAVVRVFMSNRHAIGHENT